MRNPREAMAWLVTGTGLLILALSAGLFVLTLVSPGGASPDADGMLGGIAIIAFLLLALPLLVLGGVLFAFCERDTEVD